MRNLNAELIRAGITAADAARIINRGESYAAEALAGETELTFGELVALRDAFFPEMELEYLLADRAEERGRGK